jgi:hypothetical protein
MRPFGTDGSMKKKILFSTLVLGVTAASFNASAALFDTIDSVETLQKIAAQNKEKHPDRMPAGKKDEQTTDAPAPKADEAKPDASGGQ